ncbi:transposase [Microbulbifer sp. TYP-18]|uniref:transposase n=1 Tax=Microbulbifer sp. TYP-18 TaxID=3230024 RepID=UPI0034C64C23
MTIRKAYSIEFRSEALKLLLKQGWTQAEAARRLGISKGTQQIRWWLKGLGAPSFAVLKTE